MAVQSRPELVAKLMADFRAGDSHAAGQLVELLYPELKRIAASQLSQEWKEHSWQPTLLVNELYVEILTIKGLPARDNLTDDDKTAFLGLAAHIMKRLLIHHSRPLSSKAHKVSLSEELSFEADHSDVDVERLLSRLAEVKPEIRSVVEMKVFYGLTAEDIASHLGCSAVSVHRYWQFARRWLRNELAA